MKPQNFLKVSILIAALLGSGATFASADGTSVADGATVTRQVIVTPKTEYFNVYQGDILQFTLVNGAQFNWKFDGNANYVNLADIAPKGSVKEDIKIYVSIPGENQ